ncbi:MAG TPA: hypothetical protein VH249_01660 [Xanthobacteraceae bacterium]|jgi:hypothetical protein|nr:hypothetical protein [Xanthobacteraceae bacterium]
MCEECEEIEPLTVAYFGTADRKGWRPPAAARSVPINHDSDLDRLSDRVVSGRPYAIPAPRFVCVPEGPQEVE